MDKILIAHRLSEFYMFSELQPVQIEHLANGTRADRCTARRHLI